MNLLSFPLISRNILVIILTVFVCWLNLGAKIAGEKKSLFFIKLMNVNANVNVQVVILLVRYF